MSPANAPRPCPYCDHVSPPDSKFCNECGAALHLQPCPHCGAVNDITKSSVCARCHGDLHALPALAAAAPADAPATLRQVEPGPSTRVDGLSAALSPAPFEAPTALVIEPRQEALFTPAPQKRSSLPALTLLALGLVAAGFCVYRALQAPPSPPLQPQTASAQKRAEAQAQPTPAPSNLPAPSAGRLPSTESAPSPASEAALKASPDLPDSGAAPSHKPELAAATPARPATAPTKPGTRPAPKPEPVAMDIPTQPAFSSRQRNEALQGLDLKTPPIKQCTEAVAALGLCTPETKPRSP